MQNLDIKNWNSQVLCGRYFAFHKRVTLNLGYLVTSQNKNCYKIKATTVKESNIKFFNFHSHLTEIDTFNDLW